MLKREPALMINGRAREIQVDGNDLRWIVVPIIDHPRAPGGIVVAARDEPYPVIPVLRRDWEFLFQQLKSTHAVGEYLERVAHESAELGREPIRYYELASDDAATEPQEPGAELLAMGGRLVSSPLLPMEPVASTDTAAHLAVRALFEDIATVRLQTASEVDRQRLLSELDRLPVGQRAQIGAFVVGALDEVAGVPEPAITWRFRRVVGEGSGMHLLFGAASRYWDEIPDIFSTWVQLRHYERHERLGSPDDVTTVGILVTPPLREGRPWETTVVALNGELTPTGEQLEALREVWRTDAA
jgi:hypothetical protein